MNSIINNLMEMRDINQENNGPFTDFDFENIIERLEQIDNILQEAIIDIDKFKRQLEWGGLLSPELEELIERYLQFENE